MIRIFGGAQTPRREIVALLEDDEEAREAAAKALKGLDLQSPEVHRPKRAPGDCLLPHEHHGYYAAARLLWGRAGDGRA